jgi:hypothetical protein
VSRSQPKDYSGGRVRVREDGSLIESAIGTFELREWASRIRDVSPAGDDMICVEFRKGPKRFLSATESLEALQEATTGRSMGGHSPKAHGQIRYIVRSFGKWAQGKQHICVQRIATEHPEILKGKDPNALCAWLKDQWAGTSKWRGSGKDPKQVAQDLAIEKKAGATAYARFSHSAPPDLFTDLPALVEAFTAVIPVEEILAELGIEPGDRDPYEALVEYDAALIEAEPPADPWVETPGGGCFAETSHQVEEDRARKPEPAAPGNPVVTVKLPPERREEPQVTYTIEGATQDRREAKGVARLREEFLRMDFDELHDRAAQLYEATVDPTPEGRSYLVSTGREELGRIVQALEEAFTAVAEVRGALEEADGDPILLIDGDGENQQALTDIARMGDTPGVDKPRAGGKSPEEVAAATELSRVTPQSPPNLRQGYIKGGKEVCCGTCTNFDHGRCAAYADHPVDQDDLCDEWTPAPRLNEATGPLLGPDEIADQILEEMFGDVGEDEGDAEGAPVEDDEEAPPMEEAQRVRGHLRGGRRVRAHSRGAKRRRRRRVLKVGHRGNAVHGLHHHLAEHGHTHLRGRGKFDRDTKAAVEDVQARHGLKVNGRVGHQTAAALRGRRNERPGPLTHDDLSFLKGNHTLQEAELEEGGSAGAALAAGWESAGLGGKPKKPPKPKGARLPHGFAPDEEHSRHGHDITTEADPGDDSFDESLWIGGAIRHPGALHDDLGVPRGQKIPVSRIRAAAKKGGKIGARARLALRLEGMHHPVAEAAIADVAILAAVADGLQETDWPSKVASLLPGSADAGQSDNSHLAARLSPREALGNGIRHRLAHHTREGEVDVGSHMRHLAEVAGLEQDEITAMAAQLVEAGMAELPIEQLVEGAALITERAVVLDLLEDDEVADDIGESDADLESLVEAGLADSHLEEATDHHFRRAVGHQLFRRVREGAITRKQAVRTARQRRTWRKKYGKEWRKTVLGPNWKQGQMHRLRARLFTPGGHIFFPAGSKQRRSMDSRYKAAMRSRRSAAPSQNRGAAGFRLQRRTPKTRFGGRMALGEAAVAIATEELEEFGFAGKTTKAKKSQGPYKGAHPGTGVNGPGPYHGAHPGAGPAPKTLPEPKNRGPEWIEWVNSHGTSTDYE